MSEKESSNSYKVSIVQPDLNFEAIKSNRYINNSRPVSLKITFKGNWTIKNNPDIEKITNENGNTCVEMIFQHGFKSILHLETE